MSKEDAKGFVWRIANTRNPVVWPVMVAALLALLLITFIACCICVEPRRYVPRNNISATRSDPTTS